MPIIAEIGNVNELGLEAYQELLEKNHSGDILFKQAVLEVLESVLPFIKEQPEYGAESLLNRLIEPERIITFRVPWVDDQGQVRVNRGWRVEFNSALGPYKGGIRFDVNADLDTMKFLGFEQMFKNALTSLPLGGGKGGADFCSKGHSDVEIMHFCQSYMNELYRHIGPNTDIPAGDFGVTTKEIGYLFGQYKRLTNEFTGAITGKGPEWGGSPLRPEATGYGVVYFLEEMLGTQHESIKGKRVAISGYGNVGAHIIEKIADLGGVVVTASDEYGYIYDKDGILGEKITFIKDLWCRHRQPIKVYADKYQVPYIEGRKPWEVPVDIAIPSSRQNELAIVDAQVLVNNGVMAVCEASNMGTTSEAIRYFQEHHLLFAPGMAANAGGVAVSGLEMTQNSMHLSWTPTKVDHLLKEIMLDIHHRCVQHGKEKGMINYVKGANLAGFIKIATAMLDQGVI